MGYKLGENCPRSKLSWHQIGTRDTMAEGECCNTNRLSCCNTERKKWSSHLRGQFQQSSLRDLTSSGSSLPFSSNPHFKYINLFHTSSTFTGMHESNRLTCSIGLVHDGGICSKFTPNARLHQIIHIKLFTSLFTRGFSLQVCSFGN